MGMVEKSYLAYSFSLLILIVGMTINALVFDVVEWELPILALMAVYPSLMIYAYGQYRRTREVHERAQAHGQLRLLAGGVAHDFNNVLTSINGYAQLAAENVDNQMMTRHALTEILRASERAGMLTRQLVSFAGRDNSSYEPVSLAEEIESLAGLLKPNIHPDIRIVTRAAAGLPKVSGDAVQIQQVMMNLVLNAADATTPPGEIHVDLGTKGDKVFFTVSDQGVGIPRKDLQNVFDPFFTTKPKGHGLGLAVVRNIVEAHGGSVELASQEGKGTSITITLQTTEGAEPVVKVPVPEPEKRRDDARLVLVADDEASIRHIVREVLEREGCEVIEAVDGRDCIEKYQANQEQLRAVILDIKMPHVSGWDCLRQIRVGRPDLPVLVISGYDPEAEANHELDDYSDFLEKPFRISQFLAAFHGIAEKRFEV